MRTEVGSGSRTVIGEQQHLKESQMKRSIEKEWEKISRNIKDNKENKVVKRRDRFCFFYFLFFIFLKLKNI